MSDLKRERISAKAVTVGGSDIDTDRIIPARYLKCVTFEGLGEHAFEDDRSQLKQSGALHPFDIHEFAQAQILFVCKNFGCGSSREHAPQALMRWNKGIRAIVGVSFAEIFFGNCLTLGIPCVTADEQSIKELACANRADPDLEFCVDLKQMKVFFAAREVAISMPESAREALITGRWDPTVELLKSKDHIAASAARLPYFRGWSSAT
ncbi:MAG: 3-isopropylmalate dehydratase small subunit [Deltaproteobacteria bacterium]|nr:3-isopropylmalate dehydratase small subunit [Deltaproteobacteria bacterium]